MDFTSITSHSTAGCCFCFGCVPSFFLELFLHWSPVACWAPTDLGSSSFSVLSFCHFILFMGFSRLEYWSGLPFPSPVDHILSDLSTMTRLPWVALHGMAHNFTEWEKAVVHVIRLVNFLWLWVSVCLPSEGLWKLPDGREWLKGKPPKIHLPLPPPKIYLKIWHNYKDTQNQKGKDPRGKEKAVKWPQYCTLFPPQNIQWKG